MHLRRQLLLVSLLLLSLPWAGCQFVREMEGALRQGQAQSVEASAAAIAAVLRQQTALIYPNPERLDAAPDSGQSVYALPLEEPLILDGYGDGWEEIPVTRLATQDEAQTLSLAYQAVTRGNYLYLLLRVNDPEVIYHNPGLSSEPNGDRLILRTWQDDRRQEYVIATAAPGRVQARAASRRQRGLDPRRIRGYWQDAAGGYTLELEIPLSYTGGRLGFYIANARARPGAALQTLGTIEPQESVSPPWLIYSPQPLLDSLAPFKNQGNRVQVIDKAGWLVADSPASARDYGKSNDTFWLLKLVYRSILSQDPLDTPPESVRGKVAGEELIAALEGKAATNRYSDPDYLSRTVLSTAAPVISGDEVIGAVLLRQSGEEYLSLTDRAFTRLLGYSVLAVAFGSIGLLGYASILSWRIGRLSRAASKALDDESPHVSKFPRSAAADEIGELSRNYAELLDRLREYNDYLRTLSRKLSHELRTPVAVIQTSLENLETDNDERGTYLRRAREGLQRLNGILTAMSEANRLEESIRNNQLIPTNLAPLLDEVFLAYQSVYTEQELRLAVAVESATVSGVADLLVQALDKLMENAASFCPAGGVIELALAKDKNSWAISVENDGPPLPPEMQDRLFEPMVSVRDSSGNDVHLGLGLHIARLIAEFHGGSIIVANRSAGDGVRFTVLLPEMATDEAADLHDLN